ncbi:hypothetical protein DPEC_G00144300 [Dallia pectoralis]|uniref:Uncharacterized protein n=1 Tax=Dallia pectoralis TaxID=75939 RepID=A0ACC2GP43_DALPE|nr:hypothetical protein DPEC_G00144300 [Dallia pectoralis]
MAVSMATPRAAVTPPRLVVSGRDPPLCPPPPGPCGRPRAEESETRHPSTGGRRRKSGGGAAGVPLQLGRDKTKGAAAGQEEVSHISDCDLGEPTLVVTVGERGGYRDRNLERRRKVSSLFPLVVPFPAQGSAEKETDFSFHY